MEEASAIIIDNGASTIKAGFSWEDSPRALFSPIVGRPKYTGNKNTFGLSDVYIGDNIEEKRGIIYTSNPIGAGYVKNWDDIEKVWEYTIYTELRVPPEEHPIIMTETPLSSNKCRETATQIMFEVFDVPYFYLISQWVPALYSLGLTTGLAWESGEEVTRIVPIYEGNAIYYSSNRILFAGKDITKYQIKLLRERSIDLSSTKELTITKNIKEKLCYIAEDFNTTLNESTPNYLYEEPYELPDGTSIKIKNERFRTPEILFQPELAELNFKGIHNYIP